MAIFSKKSVDKHLVVTLDEQSCRLQFFRQNGSALQQIASGEFSYQNTDELGQFFIAWLKENPCRDSICHWVLSRNLYQTYHVDRPNVLKKELDEAIKWQIKDLLDQGIDEVLVSHYQPTQAENQNNQLVAVATNKALVESIIEFTHNAGLTMASIDIEELTLGHALLPNLAENQIIGFIGEDKSGLVFNFYNEGGLAFTRHKKGRFMPNSHHQEFTLEQDQEAQQESFLLETQRTLDYVVSQIFRRPIDGILLQQNSDADDELAEIINQITELQVTLVSPQVETNESDMLTPNLVDAGAALRVGN